jgi:hypothetical protein
MLSAIGSSTYASPAVVGKPAAGLETQLEQYKVKLADWVNCSSCPPEGKAKIAELTNKISEIKQRLEATDAAKTVADAPRDKDKAATALTGIVGSRLDVSA